MLFHGHIALAFLFLLETDPQILEHWGCADEDHLDKLLQAMVFGLECWRDATRLWWFEHIGLASMCLSSSVRSTKTSAAPYPEIRNPIVVYPSNIATAILSQFFLRLLARLFVNLAVCVRALIPKFTSFFCLVEQALRRMPFFTEWSCASSFEVILARQWSHFPTWAFASGTLGSRCIFHIMLRRRPWRRVGRCRFCTLIFFVSETAIVSFRTLPVSFPLPTISRTSLFTLFCPLILDHGACLKTSISGFKVHHSQTMLDTSFYHRLQSVKSGPAFF